jgi:hypothetical protein
MTQPDTDRIPLDELTSDALDQLYAELEAVRHEVEMRQHRETRHRARIERAEAAIGRVRALATKLTTTGAIWDGNDQETGRRIRAALDPQEPQPGADTKEH